MPKGPKKEKKDKFADLSDEFKAKIDGGSVEEIEAAATSAAMEHEEVMEAKENDQDYKEAAAAFAAAGAVYKDSAKNFKLKMKYIRAVLKSRGKV